MEEGGGVELLEILNFPVLYTFLFSENGFV
jgi:hypothetical protein